MTLENEMQIHRTTFKTGMTEASVPQHCQHSIYRYIMFGEPMGSFLSAVFSNDLVEAFSNADEINTMSMKAYATFLYSFCPKVMWGSKQAVEENQGLFPVCSHCKRLKENSVDCGKHTITPLWEWK